MSCSLQSRQRPQPNPRTLDGFTHWRSTPRYRLVCICFPTPGRGLPYGYGLGLSRCLGPGECLHSFMHSFKSGQQMWNKRLSTQEPGILTPENLARWITRWIIIRIEKYLNELCYLPLLTLSDRCQRVCLVKGSEGVPLQRAHLPMQILHLHPRSCFATLLVVIPQSGQSENNYVSTLQINKKHYYHWILVEQHY